MSIYFEIDATGRINNISNIPADGEVTIPHEVHCVEVKEIGPRCCENVPIKKLFIPNTVQRIYKYAFYKCGLEELVIEPGDRLWALDDHSFAGNNFKSVTLPDNISYIGIHAFADCTMLAEIKADGVKTLAHHCFDGCNFKDDFQIPYFCSRIAKSAFHNNPCSKVTLPPFIESVESDAFSGITRVQVSSPFRHVYASAFGGDVVAVDFLGPVSNETEFDKFSQCIIEGKEYLG